MERMTTHAINCDQCEMLSINGLPCHETGCPNSGARWDMDSAIWIKQWVCHEGENHDKGSMCDCLDATDVDDTDAM